MKNIELKYELMTFGHKPNTIGLVVRGMTPPDDDERLIDFVREVAKDFTPEMCKALLAVGAIKTTRNNDPERPPDELFLQFEMPFRITNSVCDLFIPGALRFVLSYYGLSSVS